LRLRRRINLLGRSNIEHMFFKKSQAMPIDLGLCPTGRVLFKKIAEGHNGSISVESKVGYRIDAGPGKTPWTFFKK
jgi:hypothetical protein